MYKNREAEKRRERQNPTNFYKDFDRREEEIRKENWGLVTRYNMENTEKENTTKETIWTR